MEPLDLELARLGYLPCQNPFPPSAPLPWTKDPPAPSQLPGFPSALGLVTSGFLTQEKPGHICTCVSDLFHRTLWFRSAPISPQMTQSRLGSQAGQAEDGGLSRDSGAGRVPHLPSGAEVGGEVQGTGCVRAAPRRHLWPCTSGHFPSGDLGALPELRTTAPSVPRCLYSSPASTPKLHKTMLGGVALASHCTTGEAEAGSLLEFKASLGSIARRCLKTNQTNPK